MQLRIRMYSGVFVLGLALAAAPVGFSQNRPLPSAPSSQATPPPAAPTPSAPTVQAPSAPAPNANPFPPADPANFTASSPTKQTVDDFLHASWGYDPNRIWQVQGILKTPVAGVSRVVVLVTEKGQAKEQVGQLSFFTLPDGKHIISDAVLPFGSKPFEENRKILETQATGPSKGAASKDLEFVEFSDFECPHCKEAQGTVDKLLADYPTAHYVYQNFPLTQIHSEAFKAAAYGVCVAQISGNEVFFKFADAVFANQTGLTPQSSDQTLKDAVSKAGGDPIKVAACSVTPQTKAAIDASIDLGQQLNVSATPTIFVNGFAMPFSEIPYETLREIIDFRAHEDGISVPPHPVPLLQPESLK